MQALIATARGGRVPHDHIVCAVRRRNPRGTSAVLSHAPPKGDRRRSCGSNLVRPDRPGVIVKTKICSLAGVVSDSGYASVSSSHIGLVRGTRNTSETVSVEQISIAIFA